MSAVSSGSSQGRAKVREPEASQEPGSSHQPAGPPRPGTGHDPGADFGANEWLVEELYQPYQGAPGSGGRAWGRFSADSRPTLTNGTGPQPVLRAPASTAPASTAPASTAPASTAAAATADRKSTRLNSSHLG